MTLPGLAVVKLRETRKIMLKGSRREYRKQGKTNQIRECMLHYAFKPQTENTASNKVVTETEMARHIKK